MPPLGTTELEVFPLCLGGNVFGWTADALQSFAVLDAYAAAGGNFLDTADTYSRWAPGNAGGESEALIGEWMAARGNRDAMVVATKVGGGGDGLAAETIRTHAEASLRRLRTDRIDLYFAHFDDEATPLEETLGAFDALVREGKVRYVAASNLSAERIAASLQVADREGFARYVALQPEYNLLERDFEGSLRALALRERLAVVPYFALASGFLTGKYRPGSGDVDSARGGRAAAYLGEPRGPALLKVLDAVATAHKTTVAAIALAWLRAQPTVVAPIASARTPAQLAELLPMAELALDDDELARLSAAVA